MFQYQNGEKEKDICGQKLRLPNILHTRAHTCARASLQRYTRIHTCVRICICRYTSVYTCIWVMSTCAWVMSTYVWGISTYASVMFTLTWFCLHVLDFCPNVYMIHVYHMRASYLMVDYMYGRLYVYIGTDHKSTMSTICTICPPYLPYVYHVYQTICLPCLPYVPYVYHVYHMNTSYLHMNESCLRRTKIFLEESGCWTR